MCRGSRAHFTDNDTYVITVVLTEAKECRGVIKLIIICSWINIIISISCHINKSEHTVYFSGKEMT